jgi:hypothetical protein
VASENISADDVHTNEMLKETRNIFPVEKRHRIDQLIFGSIAPSVHYKWIDAHRPNNFRWKAMIKYAARSQYISSALKQ